MLVNAICAVDSVAPNVGSLMSRCVNRFGFVVKFYGNIVLVCFSNSRQSILLFAVYPLSVWLCSCNLYPLGSCDPR